MQRSNMEITKDNILVALRDVIDPELGINIVDLGLVYDVQISETGICVKMTMTTPACPLHSYMNRSVKEAVSTNFPGSQPVTVDLVWEPPWDPRMMSNEAKLQLGWKVMNNFSLGGTE